MNNLKKLGMDSLNRLSINEFAEQEKMPLILVLDNIRSGLNVGSMFRTADAFALERIVLCGITVTPPHREILKTALGSTDSVTWEHWEDTKSALENLKSEGYRVFALEQTEPCVWLQDWEINKGEKYVLVLGNEVDGVSSELLACCEASVQIPQFGTKHSLNVAVSCGMAVWQFFLRW